MFLVVCFMKLLVYKVEVHDVMLFNPTLMFPNAKDDLPQLFLKDLKGQFTCASMQKPT
jgi:hypothetical protein